MKRTVILLLSTLLVLSGIGIGVLADAVRGANPASAQGDPVDVDTVSVGGTGTVKVKPDTAYLTLGVQTQDKDAKVAQTQNATAMAAVVKAITGMGIKEDAIQTVQFSMNPTYDYTDGKQVLTGYQVVNMVTVSVKDVGKAGDVLDAAFAAGANVTQSIRFGVDDTSAYYQQALEKAVADAAGKADVMAKAAGRSVQGLWMLTEGATASQPYIYAEAKMLAMADNGSTPILSGELEISASVSATYRLK